jgi:hypothetical protein
VLRIAIPFLNELFTSSDEEVRNPIPLLKISALTASLQRKLHKKSNLHLLARSLLVKIQLFLW